MGEPLLVGDSQLSPHWSLLRDQLVAEASDVRARSAQLVPNNGPAERIVAFAGGYTQRAERTRGSPNTLVPFRTVTRNWEAWLGYREVWSIAGARFNFVSADISIFLYEPARSMFIQFVRAEWAGLVDRIADMWVHRPPDAAHPHWQIDIADAIRNDRELETALALLQESAPREFGSEAAESVTGVPPWQNVSRMHLATCMRPWLDADITHGPSNLNEIRSWVIQTVRLLANELGRL